MLLLVVFVEENHANVAPISKATQRKVAMTERYNAFEVELFFMVCFPF